MARVVCLLCFCAGGLSCNFCANEFSCDFFLVILVAFSDEARNSSLEERVTLLELQVIDITEDLGTTDENVSDLDQDINFLFDEQIIQDERIFQLETTSDQVTIELARINEDVESMFQPSDGF